MILAISRAVEREKEFDGVLELSRIAEGVKEAIQSNEGDLFQEVNKSLESVLFKLRDAIYWTATLYTSEFGGSRDVLIRDSVKKASKLPYNVRSSSSLLLTYLPIQSSLKSQINGLYEAPAGSDTAEILESLWFSLEKVEESVAKLNN